MSEIARTAVMRHVYKAPYDTYVAGRYDSGHHLCGEMLRGFFGVPETSPAIVLIAHERKVNGSYAVTINLKEWAPTGCLEVNVESVYITPFMHRYITRLLKLKAGQQRKFYVTCEYDEAPTA